MKIVITGSLGNIGKPLTKELIKHGHEVIAIGHRSANQQEIESLGATAAIGSVNDKAFLTETFTGSDAAFTMVPPNYTVPDSRAYYNSIGDSFAQAIEQSGVKRVVNLSSWGAHLAQGTGFITGAHDVEVKLNQLPGISITHLRAGFIYYNLYHFIDLIKKMDFIGSNYGGEDKIVMVSPVDIAAAAVEELEKKAVVGKSVRYVASDDRTANETAKVLGLAIGKPSLRWTTFSDDEVRKSMEQQGVPADIITNTIQLNASIHNGAMREDYDLHKPLKMGEVKLEEFAKEFAKRFL